MSNTDTGLAPEEIEATVQRTPTVLILDTSGSMEEETTTPSGERTEKIEQLNAGLELFADEVKGKEHASVRVDVAVVTFGSDVEVTQDFTSIEEWTPSALRPSGSTPMGEAIETGIGLAEDVKRFYDENGISYTRPLLWLLTDGEPTDMSPGDSQWTEVQNQLAVGTSDNHFLFFAMGVGAANMETLNALVEETGKPALKIKEGMFKEYFQFVSNSLENASQPGSDTPDKVAETDELAEFVQFD
jgi:uncharacterized protein YegL